jgi:hypothetical protein
VSVLAGVLDRMPHHRVARRVSENVTDVRQDFRALGKPEAPLLTGGEVHGRLVQSAYWSAGAALMGAGLVAGCYDGFLQVNWFIHIGSFYVHLFYLKNWWDNLFPYNWWPLYRHAAFRDIAEPAVATMAVKTLLAGRKWWGVRVSNLRLLTSPLVVVFLTLALGVLGVWLTDFAFPAAWGAVASAVGHPGFKVSAHFLGTLSASQIILGILIGQVVHRYWAPVGATLQGATLDREVDRKQEIVTRTGIDMKRAIQIDNAGWHITPAWVRLPLSPPVIRERFAEMWRGNAEVKIRKGHGRLIALATVFLVLVTLLGLVGHYWAGAGHSVPYLFPGA